MIKFFSFRPDLVFLSHVKSCLANSEVCVHIVYWSHTNEQ